MKTLKSEQIDGRRYRDIAEARAALAVFLDRVYNHERLHSALAYCPPANGALASFRSIIQGVHSGTVASFLQILSVRNRP